MTECSQSRRISYEIQSDTPWMASLLWKILWIGNVSNLEPHKYLLDTLADAKVQASFSA